GLAGRVDPRLRCVATGSGIVERRFRNGLARSQPEGAVESEFGILKVCGALFELSARLRDLALARARHQLVERGAFCRYLCARCGHRVFIGLGIEPREKIAGLDAVAFIESHLGYPAIDTEAELDLADVDIAVKRDAIAVVRAPTELCRKTEPPGDEGADDKQRHYCCNTPSHCLSPAGLDKMSTTVDI